MNPRPQTVPADQPESWSGGFVGLPADAASYSLADAAITISVVIPTHRRAAYLREAIRSVLRQQHTVEAILVVDDNDDPNESQQARAVVDEFGTRVQYLKNARGKGGCGARNTGILRASTTHVAFLDDDDTWLPEKLVEQCRLLDANRYPVVFCGYVDEDCTFGERVEVIPEANVVTRDMLFAGQCPTSTSLALARRDVLIQAGLFDETLPSFQDYDLWLRCADFGDFGVVRRPLAVFTQHRNERVSINIEKRSAGLRQFSDKWRDRFGGPARMAPIERYYLTNAMLGNAKAHYGVGYFESLRWALRAVWLSPGRRQCWQWLVLSGVGFPLGRRLRGLLR